MIRVVSNYIVFASQHVACSRGFDAAISLRVAVYAIQILSVFFSFIVVRSLFLGSSSHMFSCFELHGVYKLRFRLCAR